MTISFIRAWNNCQVKNPGASLYVKTAQLRFFLGGAMNGFSASMLKPKKFLSPLATKQ
jgi:hypothetical protein